MKLTVIYKYSFLFFIYDFYLLFVDRWTSLFLHKYNISIREITAHYKW